MDGTPFGVRRLDDSTVEPSRLLWHHRAWWELLADVNVGDGEHDDMAT